MSRRRSAPNLEQLPSQPMPTPIDDPPGATAFAPLWARFVAESKAWSSNAPALARFQAWWGGPICCNGWARPVISSICDYEFPPDDDEQLRAAAEALPAVSGRIAYTFPWSRWFEAIDERLGDSAPAFGTCAEAPSQATAHLTRAQPILDALVHARAHQQ